MLHKIKRWYRRSIDYRLFRLEQYLIGVFCFWLSAALEQSTMWRDRFYEYRMQQWRSGNGHPTFAEFVEREVIANMPLRARLALTIFAASFLALFLVPSPVSAWATGFGFVWAVCEFVWGFND